MKSSKWPKRSSNIWEFAPLFKWLLCYMFGILLYSFLGDSYILSITIACIASALLSLILIFVNWKIANKYILFPIVATFVVCCAYHLCFSSSPERADEYFGNHLAHKELVKAVVISDEKITEKGAWYLVSIVATRSAVLRSGQAKVFISRFNSMKLSCYDTLLLPNNWQKTAKYNGLFSPTIDYVQFINRYLPIIHCKNNSYPWSYVVRYECLKIWRQFIADEQIVQLMYAMLLGDATHLSPTIKDSFTKAGVAHMLALSGNNIELLIWLCWSLLYVIKNKKLNWIKYLFSLVAVMLYACICFSSPSLLRATIMCVVCSIASLIGRPHEPYNQLCVAAIIVLCFEPMWLFSIGFQLSFVAVLSLLVWYRIIADLYIAPNRYIHYLWSLVAASMAAEIFLIPLVFFHFHSFPIWFLLSNILAAFIFPIFALVGMSLIGFHTIPMVSYTIGKFFLVFIAWPLNSIQFLALHQPDRFQHIVFTVSDVTLWYLAVFSIYKLIKNQSFIPLRNVLLSIFCNILWQCCEAWDYKHKNELILYRHGSYFHTINRNGSYYTIYGTEENILEFEMQHLCNILICNRNNLLISSQHMLIVGVDTVCIYEPTQVRSSCKSMVLPYYTEDAMQHILTRTDIHTIYTTINSKASYRTTARCLKKNIDIITTMPYRLNRIPY